MTAEHKSYWCWRSKPFDVNKYFQKEENPCSKIEFNNIKSNKVVLISSDRKVLSFCPIKQHYYFDDNFNENQIELNPSNDNNETYKLYLAIAGKPIFSSYSL